MKRKLELALLVFVMASGGAARRANAAGLVADYRFHGSLASDVGDAPDLEPLGPGSNCFVVDFVGSELRKVLGFPVHNGVVLPETDTIMPNDHYSVAIRMRFNDQLGSYHRILSFDGGVADCGVYILAQNLMFFCAAQGTVAFPAGQYTDVVVTRASSGAMVGYVDGQASFSFNDTTMLGVITAAHELRFFRDNECPGACTEDAAGEAARIRIYDDALSAEEVAALENEETTTTTLSPLCGDPNESQSVTAADALQALRAAVGTSCCFAVCDVNDSGSVTASDALAILGNAVGQGVALTCPF